MAGSTRRCLKHQERQSVINCAQCHNPLCEECIAKVHEGASFCSEQCLQKNKEFKGRYKPQPKTGGFLSNVKTILVLAGIVLVLLYIGKFTGVGFAAKILDMIGLP